MADMKILDFDKQNGLLPAIIQDIHTHKVLMLGYMNQEAFEKTQAEKRVTFFSRSKQRLWTKGESSGNFLHVKQILIDCDNDTILIKATPEGPVCHTGSDTCFDEKNEHPDFLKTLQQIIHHRKINPKTDSHTSRMFKSGINKIAQKVGEEAVELVIEAIGNNEELFLNEAADLIFHFLILLETKGHSLNEVINILEKRNN